MNLPVRLPEMTQAEQKALTHYVAQGRLLGLMEHPQDGRVWLRDVTFLVSYVGDGQAEIQFLVSPSIREIHREVFMELAHAGAVERIDIVPRRYAVAVLRERRMFGDELLQGRGR